MNTFIEEMATVFGWTEADYSKGDLLDYYRANVKNDPKLEEIRKSIPWR